MSRRDEKRACLRCGRELASREHYGEGGLTVTWKCICGWASARTVPCAVDARGAAREHDEADPSVAAFGRPPRVRSSSGVSERPVEGPAEVETRESRTSKVRGER
jgi:hypothetical protein